jgi:ferric-dicitrate binding protein FerR (iron transport regulator)
MYAAAASIVLVSGYAIVAGVVWPGSTREYRTAPGERVTIQLADGSTVKLAPQSRLSVPRDFGPGRRELELVGQASFDVRHDSASPLRVRAGDAVIQDIGTYFVVSAYPNAAVRVEVTEGEAKLSGRDGKSVDLRAGRAGTVASNGHAAYQGNVPKHARDWETGQLTFDDDSLRTVLNSLARWYDLDIRADADLYGRHVTAVFVASKPNEMIDALATALGATATRKGRVVTLTQNR